MRAMGTMASRYDRYAERYERWWAPVLRPTVAAFLEWVAPAVEGSARLRILDVGAGTGNLAIAAVRRFPTATVMGIDGSAGMLGQAERAAAATLTPAQRSRLQFREGLADRVPADDGAFDLVISSFVMQLVPDRRRALREAHRVVTAGGRVGYVAWRQDRAPFEPDAAWGRALDEAGAPDVAGEDDARSGDIASPRAAVAQLRRAGFSEARAREVTLEKRWDRRSFLAFLELYDEADYLAGLDATMRRRIHDAARREFAGLSPSAFTWRTPVVMAVARRPGQP